MSAITTLLRAVRHAPGLERADRLWDAVRPGYRALVRIMYGRRGIRVSVYGGERMRLDPSCESFAWVGEDLFWRTMMGEIRRGDHVADVGANVGVYTIGAARRGATVTSFEPNPLTAALLKRNLVLNHVQDAVQVRTVAVAAEPGTLSLLPVGALDCAARIDPDGDIAVRAETLEGPFDIVKIDVEGYELEVLRGAVAVLSDTVRRPRAIFLEVHPTMLRRAGGSLAELRQLLTAYDIQRCGVRDFTEHWVCRAV